MNCIIRGPYPVLVIVRGIFLYEHGVLRRDGVDIAITIFGAVFLVDVKCLPGAFHPHQFVLGGKVAGFAVAPQRRIPYKGELLAVAQLVHHPLDIGLEGGFQGRVIGARICEGQGGHIMP